MKYPGFFLEQLTAPACICDAEGELLWSNLPLVRLFSPATPPKALKDFLGPGAVRRVLAATHLASFQVEDARDCILALRPSAVVIANSLPEMASSTRLLMLHSIPSLDSDVKERKEYLAAIAHDLKNPLGAIFGYADILLEDQGAAALSTRQRELILRMRNTSMRSIDLVRNYQYLVALRDGGEIQTDGASDLNEVIRSVVESVWRQNDPGISLVFNLREGSAPARIQRMDAERIFSNLFSNAVKYTPSPGRIEVTTASSASQTLLKISNNPGFIPESEREKIFECFSRASNAKDTPGTGLGLYIVKAIAERAGGTVSLTSSPADGTCFTVALRTPAG